MDLQALKACKEAANSVKEATRKNTENANYNADQDAAWGGAHSAWQQRQENWSNNQADWDSSKETIFQTNGYERIETRNNGCFSYDWWCGNDYNLWVDDGEMYWGCGKRRRCKKGEQLRRNDALQTITQKRGPRPGDFTEQEPQQNTNEYVHKGDVIPLAPVTCCANILNIVASDLSNTNINQVNDCSNKLDKLIKGKDKDAENKAAADKAAADQAAADKAATDQAAADKIISDKLEKAKSKKRNTYIIIGILIFLLCCCSSSSIIGLFSFEDTGNDDYYN